MLEMSDFHLHFVQFSELLFSISRLLSWRPPDEQREETAANQDPVSDSYTHPGGVGIHHALSVCQCRYQVRRGNGEIVWLVG